MQTENKNILTINGGSSSIKFSMYSNETSPVFHSSGKIENLGSDRAILIAQTGVSGKKESRPVMARTSADAVQALISWLEERNEFQHLAAIGQRIVHGMEITKAQYITESLLDRLQEIRSYDPDHLPGEIELIRAFRKRLPEIPQIACFDTAFHTTIPRLARLLPIPLKYERQGIKKYGFHGLSYAFLMGELSRMGISAASNGRVLLAHLGSGASVAAVKNGKCIDTSMGFTPTGGLVMSTRTGDLDPGLVSVLMKKESMNPDQFNNLVNKESGLQGLSEISSDMQELLEKESTDVRAADAIHFFCYEVKKWIGSFAVVLEGLDVLVFSGGIGENAPAVRARICAGLAFMGIELDQKKNESRTGMISSKSSRVQVYVIPTNEEIVIAGLVNQVISKK